MVDNRTLTLVARRGALEDTGRTDPLDFNALRRVFNRMQDIAYFQEAGGGNPTSPVTHLSADSGWRSYLHNELKVARRKSMKDGDDNGFFSAL